MKDDLKYRLKHPGYKCKCCANSSCECGCDDGGWPRYDEVLAELERLENENQRLQDEKPFPDRALVYQATQIRNVMEDLVDKLEKFGGNFDVLIDAKALIRNLS